MTDHEPRDLRDLLTDAVADVEPGYAFEKIRARTTTTKRRWPYAAGGAVLAVAASFAAFAVLGNDALPRATDPQATTSPTPSPSPSPSTSATETPSGVIAVYYVGDTPDGPRLYREFWPSDFGGDALKAGMVAVLTQPPQDPDYRSVWPGTGTYLRSVDVVGDVIRIDLDPAATQTHGLPEAERRTAIEQVIYTAQAAVQDRLPVQFLVNGNPSAEILGLPASEPLANGPVLDTLAHVSLTTPSEGMVVDNDEPLVVEGVGNSFDGSIATYVDDTDGTSIINLQHTSISGAYEDGLFPFTISLDLTGVPPGDYVIYSKNSDPTSSGDLQFHTDSRHITVVD